MQSNQNHQIRRGLPVAREKGNSFVEFALAMPFLLTLVAAMMDLGWMYLQMVSLREAVQEAATYAAVCPKPENHAGIRSRLRSSSSDPVNLLVIADADITICVLSGTTCPSPTITPAVGEEILVQATFHHTIITPLVGSFIGDQQQYPMTASARSKILAVPGDGLNLIPCDL